jgi:hypothetical protein
MKIMGKWHASRCFSCKSHHVNAIARVEENSRGEYDNSDFEESCILHETSVSTFPQIDSRNSTCIVYTRLQ